MREGIWKLSDVCEGGIWRRNVRKCRRSSSMLLSSATPRQAAIQDLGGDEPLSKHLSSLDRYSTALRTLGLDKLAASAMWWLRVVETWAVARLLSSPTFHRFVQNTHKTMRRMRHGPDMEDMGGTKLDNPNAYKDFTKHFWEELKSQARGGPPKKP